MSLEKTAEMEGIPSFKIPDVNAVEEITSKASGLQYHIFNYLSIMYSYCDTNYIPDGYYVSGGPTPSDKFKEIYETLYNEIEPLATGGGDEGFYTNYYYLAREKAREILQKKQAYAENEYNKVVMSRTGTYGNSSTPYTDADKDKMARLQRDIKKIKGLLKEV